MKIVKKISYVILVLVLLSAQVVIPDWTPSAQATTLKGLKQQLADLEAKYEANKHKQEATEKEIQNAKDEINRIAKERDEIEEQISELNAEIDQLRKDIDDKNNEIKDIISYYQVSATGTDAYLEYVFMATDLTDFIYRMAVAEQLSEYNASLIDDYESLIIKHEEKTKELNEKNAELENKRKEMEKQISKLTTELQGTMEGALSIEEEIDVLKTQIQIDEKLYKEYECEETMEKKACEEAYAKKMAEKYKDTLPPGTPFYRPVTSGYISSEYGPRGYLYPGEVHYGLDFATSHGSNVYAVSDGKVVAVIDDAKQRYDKNKKYICGGNKVYIIHTVDGKNYTSTYMHLASVKVKVGDIVTRETVIGLVGGSPSIEYWDNCSSGSHVHLMMSYGHYLSDMTNPISNSFNPRKVVNAPPLGSNHRFSNRYTKY